MRILLGLGLLGAFAVAAVFGAAYALVATAFGVDASPLAQLLAIGGLLLLALSCAGEVIGRNDNTEG